MHILVANKTLLGTALSVFTLLIGSIHISLNHFFPKDLLWQRKKKQRLNALLQQTAYFIHMTPHP